MMHGHVLLRIVVHVVNVANISMQGLQREHPDLEDHPLLIHNSTVFKEGQDALQVTQYLSALPIIAFCEQTPCTAPHGSPCNLQLSPGHQFLHHVVTLSICHSS